MALDKTGTLTAGKPEVTDVVPAGGATADELLRVAAAVERKSQHPLARAVVRRAEAQGLALPESGELHSVTARGVRSTVDGRPVEIGSLRLWDVEGGSNGNGNGAATAANVVPPEVEQAVDQLRSNGRSVVVVRHGERFLGVLGLADLPRPNVRGVIDRLRAMGVRPIVMLTGDNRGVADAVGREVGVDDVHAELLPEEKVKVVRQLQDAYDRVAMVGDGVNDAPALAAATVGVAMGGAGTAAALETADVALMGDDLSRLLFAAELSRKANRIIRQNVGIALGVIVMLIVSTTTGLIGIGPAVFFHEGSTLLVIFNALRLLAYNGTAENKPMSKPQ
jgi:Cd2+/Zn2+-exporting ATPase